MGLGWEYKSSFEKRMESSLLILSKGKHYMVIRCIWSFLLTTAPRSMLPWGILFTKAPLSPLILGIFGVSEPGGGGMNPLSPVTDCVT